MKNAETLHNISVHARRKCDLCESTFSTKKNKDEHILRVHEGKKYYRCRLSFCELTFKTKKRRRKHISSVHEGQKPYKCELCEKKFLGTHNLKVHMRWMGS